MSLRIQVENICAEGVGESSCSLTPCRWEHCNVLTSEDSGPVQKSWLKRRCALQTPVSGLVSGETVAGLAGYSTHSETNEVKHSTGKKLLDFNPNWTG